MLMLSVTEVLFVFVALPLIAEPPVVLRLTVTSPDAAVWMLSFVTHSIVSFVTLVWLLTRELMTLVESGPVVSIEPALAWLADVAGAIAAVEEGVLLTVAATAVVLALLAVPEAALPLVVLRVLLTSPVVDIWSLVLVTTAVFVLRTRRSVFTRDEIRLYESVPVLCTLPVCADTAPPASPTAPSPMIEKAVIDSIFLFIRTSSVY